MLLFIDAGTTSSSCTEEHSPTDQQQVISTGFLLKAKCIVAEFATKADLFHEGGIPLDFEVTSPGSFAFQCVVEVGASSIILDNREQEIEVEQNESTTNDVITTLGTVAAEEVGSLEVAFLYDAPMREMTVRIRPLYVSVLIYHGDNV